MKFEGERILFAADMAGTLLFAVEGASAAIGGNLDLLGLMVLAFATALGGGIVRDVLIGGRSARRASGLALRGRSLPRRHHGVLSSSISYKKFRQISSWSWTQQASHCLRLRARKRLCCTRCTPSLPFYPSGRKAPDFRPGI
jgi:hypothetical protein